jgi:predicted neuraminidase
MKPPFFALFCLFALLPLQNRAADLERLAYNNPGLVVDLGVGLWAWPMPMDYDGDGDLDLLVACPDNPSNGVYFFENPTQDPQVKMPVFRPGVRLGPASQNMQVSYVDGVPRILAPGVEHLDFKAKGFDKPAKIYPKTNIHENAVRANMWRYVDYDGDGDPDIIVGVGDWTDYGWDQAYDASGRWLNGPLHGYVYWIENRGKPGAPDYSDHPVKIQAGGGVVDVFGWPSPNVADFDHDGDLDLLCGEFLDGFTYFENTGTRQKPIYSSGRRLGVHMDLEMITPVAYDWDRDGDLDLICGDEDGRVAFIENTGSFADGVPVFLPPVYFRQGAETLKFGTLATPFAFDWDQDGDEDILCGNTAGYLGWFENLGLAENGLPKWAAPRRLQLDGKAFRVMAGPNGSVQGPCEAKWGYTSVTAADWDGNHQPDLFVNTIWGRLLRLERKEKDPLQLRRQSWDILTGPAPGWTWWQAHAGEPVTQWRTTPFVSDSDSDGAPDLVALDREGYLARYHKSTPPERAFLGEDLQPLRLNAKSSGGAGRINLCLVDWDGDGRLDLITNSENAAWYRNCADHDGKPVFKRIGNLAQRNVSGHNSSPTRCDFDRDGHSDLLIGAEDGRLYHIKHADCISYSGSQITLNPPAAKPEPKFPGFVRDEFIFTSAPFPQCHASTICETSRGLVAAWFGGTKESAPDVGIWVSYHDGSSWSAPKQWATGVQSEGKRYPCWNPVLYQPPGDAPTLLFFKVGPSPSTWWGEMMVSYDRGRTFRDRRRLPEGIDGPVRSKPLLLPDGPTLLSGSSTESDGWRVHFEKCRLLNGEPAGTWRRIGPINEKGEFNAIQPTFLQHRDGRLQVLCRTQESTIVTSFSSDLGQTWSKLEPIGLPNPNSGIEAVTLADGRHVLLYNHLGSGPSHWGKRGLLNLAISDDGKVWRKLGVVEQAEKGEFSYPAMIQSQDGLLHLTYTWNRQRIKHVVVDPAGFVPGAALSLDPW